jgi:PAS domain S-box-containing protein
MMQEVYELPGVDLEIRSRIVSLNPINPANAPDQWEKKALASFVEGESVVSSLEVVDGQPHMRLMRPLLTDRSCTGCHEERDREIGSVRGGISVTVPMSLVWPTLKAETIRRVTGYSTTWLLGMVGIGLGTRTLRRQIQRRHKIEEALRESRFRIREIAANIPGVVYQFLWNPKDHTYSFPFISKGLTRILGIDPEDVYRDPLGFFPGALYQEELEPLFESIVEAADNLTAWHREIRCKTTDGEVKWIGATSRPHSLPDGTVLFNGVFLDITDLKSAEARLQEAHSVLEDRVVQRTVELQKSNQRLLREVAERKRAEQWLLKSEEQLRSFFELGIVGMAVTSPDRYWEEVNPQLCKMLGYSENELTQKTWDELTHPEDLETEQAHFERILSGVVSEYAIDKRFIRKDGQPVCAVISVKCVYDSQGDVENLVMLVRDTHDPR